MSVELSKPSGPSPSGDSGGSGDGNGPREPEVGRFRQGTPLSQWALARYLVGRAIGTSIGTSLLVVAVVLLALAVLVQWSTHLTFVTVLLALAGVLVLAFRGLVRLVLRRLTAADRYGPLEDRLHALVGETRGAILAELRRVGLPGRSWTLPLLAIRLVRPRRRAETLERLRAFDVDRAVTPARVDELHHLLRAAFPGSAGVSRGPCQGPA
ncbi:MAG: hypothetical protein ACTHMS_14385 [Jatrophihabitans sp.]|uniref:hypothetical protein n=1 Tax=Jatrophihabitans sp. TaxID=1932789 RepID=UPI003F8037C7